jgi:hypothetical protein
MVRDAWAAKEFFPVLKEVRARWKSEPWFFLECGGIDLEGAGEQKVGVWLDLMRLQAEWTRMVPPAWLKVEFVIRKGEVPQMGSHQKAFNEALDRLREEMRVLGPQHPEDELEESGRKWLEHAWADSKRHR